jgi:hypothetical protein
MCFFFVYSEEIATMFGDDWCPDLLLLFCKQVRTQQIHEMKKKEKEYIKLQASICIFKRWWCNSNSITITLKTSLSNLQEKLNQVLMEKKKESSRSGMEIMNLLQVAYEPASLLIWIDILFCIWVLCYVCY